MKTIRVNLGCGGYPLDGWVNVDLNPPADVVGDFRELDLTLVSEVRMIHVLEHLPRADVMPMLQRIRSWMVPNGELVVEVPDMETILGRGVSDSMWEWYVYGSQQHEGEFHRTGFTMGTLWSSLTAAGFRHVNVERFLSDHEQRPGMPCLGAMGIA